MSTVITSQKLAKFPGIKALVSTRSFGNQSFQHLSISEKETILNRRRFFDKQGINADFVVNTGLSHEDKVYCARISDRGRGAMAKKTIIPNYDGLVTNNRNVFLMVTVADCFPIFYYDPKANCIGIAHAGWRGVLNGISINVIDEMKKVAGSKPEDIIVFIGPGIQACHFEVSIDLASQFENAFGSEVIVSRGGNRYANLSMAIKSQLESSGINSCNIEISSECTYCADGILSSYRRDKGGYIAQAAVIGMI
ncbi:peptidoglycan editing factor PgeF [Patescibacteria group bacterium]|nr:peptidoglycan editing factor PgeF [Patescibacteria group bacterium]